MSEIAELATVRLRRAVGRWPAGTRGVIVNYRPGWDAALVEFAEALPLPERAAADDAELVPWVDVEDLEPVEAPTPTRTATR